MQKKATLPAESCKMKIVIVKIGRDKLCYTFKNTRMYKLSKKNFVTLMTPLYC